MEGNIASGKLWNYFVKNKEALEKEYHRIAVNGDGDVEIYLAREKGFPYFSVEVDGEQVYTAETVSSLDAETTYEELLSLYITPDEGEVEDDFQYDDLDEDEERVTDITCAMEDLLQVLLDADPYKVGMSPQQVDELVSIVEQHLYDDYGFSVRHPTFVDGITVQYPFGDPNEDEAD